MASCACLKDEKTYVPKTTKFLEENFTGCMQAASSAIRWMWLSTSALSALSTSRRWQICWIIKRQECQLAWPKTQREGIWRSKEQSVLHGQVYDHLKEVQTFLCRCFERMPVAFTQMTCLTLCSCQSLELRKAGDRLRPWSHLLMIKCRALSLKSQHP